LFQQGPEEKAVGDGVKERERETDLLAEAVVERKGSGWQDGLGKGGWSEQESESSEETEEAGERVYGLIMSAADGSSRSSFASLPLVEERACREQG
jgi:hypothetical protein